MNAFDVCGALPTGSGWSKWNVAVCAAASMVVAGFRSLPLARPSCTLANVMSTAFNTIVSVGSSTSMVMRTLRPPVRGVMLR